MRVAPIAGVSGQDGRHLARLLLAAGTTVWGATRDGRPPAFGCDTLVDLIVDAELAAHAAGATR
ncbi:MAG TPA: NAD-dependent epimerase/dehydratase family protein [Thermomicrobiales bacterium]|nr:NAD-dependent epimerase/dehydratase family protein [Thermomicrobiales bacterium]